MSTSIMERRDGTYMLLGCERELTPDNEHSPGLLKMTALAFDRAVGAPVHNAPDVTAYWHFNDGVPYLVVEIDTFEEYVTDGGTQIKAAGYKVYVNDQHVAGDGHG